MIKWRRVLGVQGINRRENPHAIFWANFFDSLMVIILLWLPFQWYFQDHGELSHRFIEVLDWLIWLVFVCEMLVLTHLVKNVHRYIRGNWLNILIIIFAFPVLWDYTSSYVAFIRYLRLLVLLRLTSVQLQYVFRILKRNNFGMTMMAFFIVTILSGIFASYLDPHLSPPWKGIWWAWETITTVGYGDIVPHTATAKAFAMLLMVMGVCLVSVVAANFAAFLLGDTAKQQDIKILSSQLTQLEEKLDMIIGESADKPGSV